MVVRELELDLDAFEGPFDLLLTLLLKEELEPADVDMAAIVVAFVERLAERDELDLEACGEFLVLIAALLELKARALFPDEEAELADLEPEEAAEELARRLAEYRRMKEAAAWLSERLAGERDRYFRIGPAALAPRPERKLAPQDPEQLAATLRLLAAPPPEVSLSHMALRFPPVSQFLERFRAVLRTRRRFDFDAEVGSLSRVDQAVAFLALLELRKAGEIALDQAAPVRPDKGFSPAAPSWPAAAPPCRARLRRCLTPLRRSSRRAVFTYCPAGQRVASDAPGGRGRIAAGIRKRERKDCRMDRPLRLITANPVDQLARTLEALLVVASAPLSVDELADAAADDVERIELALGLLSDRYREGRSGIVLEHVAGGYAFRAAREAAEACGRLFERPIERGLSQAAMETLSIVAYLGPCSRPEIARIRGVAADSAVAGLLERGLIAEAGRDDGAGGAVRYRTTPLFERVFGLESAAALPRLDDLGESAAEIRERLHSVAVGKTA